MRELTLNRRRRRRGYLLIEVLIGSALVAGALAGILELIGHGREQEIFVSRDFIATQLAEQGLEISRAEALKSATTLSSLGAGTTSIGTMTVPVGLQGTYTRTRIVVAGVDTIGASTGIDYRDVTVTVSYLTRAGTRTVTSFTRVYERTFFDSSGGGT